MEGLSNFFFYYLTIRNELPHLIETRIHLLLEKMEKTEVSKWDKIKKFNRHLLNILIETHKQKLNLCRFVRIVSFSSYRDCVDQEWGKKSVCVVIIFYRTIILIGLNNVGIPSHLLISNAIDLKNLSTINMYLWIGLAAAFEIMPYKCILMSNGMDIVHNSSPSFRTHQKH